MLFTSVTTKLLLIVTINGQLRKMKITFDRGSKKKGRHIRVEL